MFPCISKTVLGIECLGCGFQRAIVLLFKGNYKGAFEIYPAVFSSLILLIFVGLHYLHHNKKYKKILVISFLINGAFMIAGYYYKHLM